jgi:hypothetical protein
MKVVSFEGLIENGCIHVPAGVLVPENAKVYVVVPGLYEDEVQRAVHIPNPRLVHPEQASDFVKKVVDPQDGK